MTTRLSDRILFINVNILYLENTKTPKEILADFINILCNSGVEPETSSTQSHTVLNLNISSFTTKLLAN